MSETEEIREFLKPYLSEVIYLHTKHMNADVNVSELSMRSPFTILCVSDDAIVATVRSWRVWVPLDEITAITVEMRDREW